MQNEQQIIFCNHEDDWTNSDEAIEQAAQNAFDDLGADEAKTTNKLTLYKGVKVQQSFSEYLSTTWLIDDMQQRAYDNSSEFAEDYLNDVTDEQKTELEQLIVGWANKHKLKPSWFMIEQVQEVSFKVPDEWKSDL